jgi:hypothetical protein
MPDLERHQVKRGNPHVEQHPYPGSPLGDNAGDLTPYCPPTRRLWDPLACSGGSGIPGPPQLQPL